MAKELLNKGYLTAKTDKTSDEVYTPTYAVLPLIKYINLYKKRNNLSNITIWCPFDLDFSNYVIEFKKAGFNVIATHIDNQQDFFNYEPKEHYDIIISNPPFSIKDSVLKRLYELNKPYAMLFPVATLQGVSRFKYMNNIQYLGFDKRINFYKDIKMEQIQKGIAFGSCYLCKKFLPKDLIIEQLKIV